MPGEIGDATDNSRLVRVLRDVRDDAIARIWRPYFAGSSMMKKPRKQPKPRRKPKVVAPDDPKPEPRPFLWGIKSPLRRYGA